jgi:hypothetical protein
MALTVYQGYQGSVKFHASGGAVATVAGVTAWSISIDKQIISTTSFADTYEKNVGGLVSGSGSIELMYTAENVSLIAAVNATEDPGTALFELYLDTDGGKKISFAGIIDSAEYGSSTDDVQRVICSFVTNGTITTTL